MRWGNGFAAGQMSDTPLFSRPKIFIETQFSAALAISIFPSLHY